MRLAAQSFLRDSAKIKNRKLRLAHLLYCRCAVMIAYGEFRAMIGCAKL